MESPQPPYVWQQARWPALRYDGPVVAAAVARARRAQGVVEGKLAVLGFEQRTALAAEAWVQEALSTAAIEGEQLDLLAVRSSVARRLGGSVQKGRSAPRHVDGLLDIMDDALVRAAEPLTHQRLSRWQAALFPTGLSGLRPVRTGAYRDQPMQIVSGPHGRETVHYEAPPAAEVRAQMQHLLDWFNADRPGDDAVVTAALAHLWFETVHPFDDGNGRIGRNIVDLCLARDAGESSRLVRVSQRLLEEREAYYGALSEAQHGGLEITPWMTWFIGQVHAAWEQASGVVDASLVKARFWAVHAKEELTARQRKAVNVLLDHGPGGYEGGMSTRKYEGLTGASRATASRELVELAQLGLLRQSGAGRSVRYSVALPGWE